MQKTWFDPQEVLLEKEMATHSSILAWEIPWTGEPGRLQSMGPKRVGHDFATKQQPHNSNMCSVHIFYWMSEDLLLRQEK